ncbi:MULTISPECIES: hypothetical protein [Micrococcaceae]|uniref:hypothetical protein n=1 Tax=Micrococcaceae TaxID=1268 RepID=UPI0013DDC0C5|nr:MULTISPECIES: hypothetical protein [Micrococcaceae]
MEIFVSILIVSVLLVVAATVAAILHDGRGHLPRIDSRLDWSALELPSSSHTSRLF